MKKKVKIKDEENFDFMKTNKDNLKNVLKKTDILPIINDLVERVNKIVIHTYQFLKLYLINLYNNNKQFPLIDKDFLCDIFKVITVRKCGSGGYTNDNMPDQLRTLTDFYKNHYSKLIVQNEILYYDKLPYILAYEAIDMITNINNNIEQHLIDHINKYVNIHFEVKRKADEITKNNKDKKNRKELHKKLYDEFKKVKNDLITFGEMASDKKYHKWIIEQKLKLFPNKKCFDKNNIYYDLKSNTQDFMVSMFYILNELEKINEQIIKDNKKNNTEIKQIRMFNVLPLRTNIVPKNICIDTCALICNFLGDESTSKYLANYKKENKYNELWSSCFYLDNKVFKKNKYKFSYMIRTDGISCCILFIKTDKNGEPLKKTNKNKKCREETNTDYIEKTVITDKMRKKKVVCADPNYSDLIYCGSKDENNKLQTFRYTQNQRRVETCNKKYSKIIDKENKSTIINNKSVKKIETDLSKYNSKTCNSKNFEKYITEKNKTNSELSEHYKQSYFRKFKLNRFINTQKSESKMIKNFTNKFGKSEDVLFVIGDYDKGDYNMRGKEPAICKKFRRIFKNAGFETYLINEFRTSKLCNECHEELEKFLERKSHKPNLYKENKNELVHGLLRCQSVKHKCEIFHNRDKNSVQNMLDIVKSIFEEGKRPAIFTRTE